MKKLQIIFLSIFFLIFPAFALALAEKPPVYITVFYGEGCPHCEHEKTFLDSLTLELPQVITRYLEVWYNQQNNNLMAKVGEALDFSVSGVPFSVVGEQPMLGFNTAQTTGVQIRNLVTGTYATGSSDYVGDMINNMNSLPAAYNPLALSYGRLIKNERFAEVFFVDEYLCLRWVINEKAAAKYFGSGWNRPGNILEFSLIPSGYKFCSNME